MSLDVTATAAAGMDWAERTFVLTVDVPGTRTTPCQVWSPILRQHVLLPAAELDFLRRFGNPAAPGQAEGPEDLLRLYLRIQRYELLGILVERLVLSADDVGALHVDSTTVRDLCAGADAPPDGHITAPVLKVCRRPAGGLALLNGAEVACAAFLLNQTQPVEVLQPAEFLRRVVDSPGDFFGTMRGDVPYQSICCNRMELVRGRRRALYERLALVQPADLRGRAVLDLGCNVGMNCYLAVEMGARRATGVDGPERVSAATALNAFYGRPCQFLSADLNRPLNGIERHDTVFLFSVLGHLGSVTGVLDTIERAGARAVYVETHRQGEPQGDLELFFGAPIIRRIELIGHCENSALEDEMTRRMYRCEVGVGSG